MATNIEKAKDTSIRYDRQVRLWGADAQRALSDANICLVNATGTGTEALKNLILPGIKAYTVLDGAKVNEADCGANFFVTPADIGKSRAEVCSSLLQELNDLVSGSMLNEDPTKVINERLEWFDSFDAVMLCQSRAASLSEETVLKLSAHLLEKKIPLFLITCNGMIGTIRIQCADLALIDSRPQGEFNDLRLGNPWPELKAFLEEHSHIKFETQDRSEDDVQYGHAHVPYIAILYNELQRYQKENEGKTPSRVEFGKIIREKAFDFLKELNFSEARKNVKDILMPHRVAISVKKLFRDARANVTDSSEAFWVLVAALKQFVDENKAVPLPGNLPDMTCTSAVYVNLQQIFKAKAQVDVKRMGEIAQAIQDKTQNKAEISASLLQKFCKLSQSLRVENFNSLQSEWRPTEEEKARAQQHSRENANNENYKWYLCMRAASVFYNKHNRYPGSNDAQIESDIPELKNTAMAMCKELGISAELIEDEKIHEMCRFGGTEPHTIASFMGGVAAQEVIKVVAKVFSPLNNYFLYNGLISSGFRFDA